MKCENSFIQWNVQTIDSSQTIKLTAYDIAFENRNAFNVLVNNYPVQPNIPFIVNTMQPGKIFCQSFAIDFGSNVGSIFVHTNEDAE